jgi:hypothetical protein
MHKRSYDFDQHDQPLHFHLTTSFASSQENGKSYTIEVLILHVEVPGISGFPLHPQGAAGPAKWKLERLLTKQAVTTAD